MSHRTLGDSALILAASMPRSASTWLYNVARLLIARLPEAKDQFSCGWVGDWQAIPKKPYMPIKIHDYHQGFADASRLVLYSYRDIRDALASVKRKFDRQPSLALADHWIAQDEK